jgi:hypothetical protein
MIIYNRRRTSTTGTVSPPHVRPPVLSHEFLDSQLKTHNSRLHRSDRTMPHQPPNMFLTTNQTLAGRSASRRMYHGNQYSP